MQAYLVWDIKERKKREVSFFHSVVHEGFYPFRNKKLWSKEERDLPLCFSPTFEDIITEEEFKKFDFSKEEEKEILEKYFSRKIEKESESKEEEKYGDVEEESSGEKGKEIEFRYIEKETPNREKEKKREEKKEIFLEKEKYIFPSAKERTHYNSDFWRNILREEGLSREKEDRKSSEKEREREISCKREKM